MSSILNGDIILSLLKLLNTAQQKQLHCLFIMDH